jgi:hypothetical protein
MGLGVGPLLGLRLGPSVTPRGPGQTVDIATGPANGTAPGAYS